MSNIESGIGLVYWPGLEPLFEAEASALTSLEVEVEAFWFQSPREPNKLSLDYAALQRITRLPQIKVVHGVGAALGTCATPNQAHLDAMCESIKLLDAKWYSGHLAFNRVKNPHEDYATGFLLPPLLSEDNLHRLAGNICQVRDRLQLPIALETGVNYLRRQGWEMHDGEFTAKLCGMADCDILMDVHNIWTNQINGRMAVEDFLSPLDPARIRELHLAGGFEYQGFWLDAHSGLVPDEVFEIARDLVPRLPNLRAIHIEILPQFVPGVDLAELQDQIKLMQQIWETRATQLSSWYSVPNTLSSNLKPPQDCTPENWESTCGALVTGREDSIDTLWQQRLASDPGIPLFMDLARTFRAGIVVDLLKMSSRYMMLSLGKETFRKLLKKFWKCQPPQAFGEVECLQFAHWIREQDLDLALLDNLLDYDLALTAMGRDNQARLVAFDCEPMALLQALGEGGLPAQIPSGRYELELTPD